MANEILVDLKHLHELAHMSNGDLAPADEAGMVQVLATIALCERLDVMNNHLGTIAHEVALIDGNLATTNSMRA